MGLFLHQVAAGLAAGGIYASRACNCDGLPGHRPVATLTKKCGAIVNPLMYSVWQVLRCHHGAEPIFTFSMRAGSTSQKKTASEVLRVTGARKVYGDLEVIRNVSLNVAANEFVSILGPSGCGKSTLLMMVAGLIERTGGDILINGEPVTGPRREVGVVFQQPVLLPWRTVLDNVLLPIELLKLPRKKYRQRAMDLLTMAKIGEFADRLPRQLSGGMRQRASICCALIHDPGILLMDEPFSALDAITRDEMGVELLRIWQVNRKTVVFVTHSIREAAFLSDRVLVMGQRPAIILEEVAIDLPRPRQISMMEDERFNQYVRRLRKSIEASHVR
jgi:NitT/TauT family transport system ATP-binding protein